MSIKQNEEVTVKYVHWRETQKRSFIFLWSDGTWEEFQLLFDDYYVGDQSYKQFMNLSTTMYKKMTKSEAIEYYYDKCYEALDILKKEKERRKKF